MLKKGWSVEGTADDIIIKKDKIKIEFNVKIPMAKGVLFGVKIHLLLNFCGVASAKTSP
jgi:hypothetical protein